MSSSGFTYRPKKNKLDTAKKKYNFFFQISSAKKRDKNNNNNINIAEVEILIEFFEIRIRNELKRGKKPNETNGI